MAALLWFLFGCVAGGLMVSALWYAHASVAKSVDVELTRSRTPDEIAPDEVDEPPVTGMAEVFTVDRKPRTVPWHIKRRELEAQHRTKRKAREEFRGE